MHERPKIVVAGVVMNNGKVLLTRETLESGNHRWIIPGGKVEFGEALEEALLREMKEETGLDIQVEKFLSFKQAIYPQYNYHSIIFFFLARPLNLEFHPNEEPEDIGFFSPEEAAGMDLVHSARWILERIGFILGQQA